ncbi:TIGR03118 family protein [Pontibacter diazotrophicus]|uniref:TIGR03118 family protein n=1 Tax=Pontibacter diazotrophicus TaxID=1400979 RepID=A0A3D8LE42_9BACT|nr:TIGR03118 family protein [Pontibacter diazotrophicus]RDV15670.1 TIGR03118 family protein [Pontibacter diazotrophicus]
MKKIDQIKRNTPLSRIAILLFILIFISTGCDKLQEEFPDFFPENPRQLKDYRQVDLVANTAAYDAARVDPTLINAWGITFSPGGVIWPTAEGTGLSYLYNQDGDELRGPVTIPSPTSETGGHPTGIVFNGSSGFQLPNGQPARFIFVGADGVISGWNGGDAAVKMIDNSSSAAYTGLAIASDEGETYLYAANYRERKIEVYDSEFNEVSDMLFMDPAIPAGYAPFNIQNVGDRLYVTYAKVAASGKDEAGLGNGYVNIFYPDGNLERRFASKGVLNSPWGIAQAPDGFIDDGSNNSAAFRNVILVGNFGDGRINAYTANGKFIGQLRDDDSPIAIDGLWAIAFPPSTATTIDQNRLYFAAGPDEETDGLFGYITK